MKKLALTATALLAALALTGCSGGGNAAGELQEVGVSGSDVRANMTITSVDTLPLADVDGIEIDGYENGTLFLAHASLQLTDGDFTEVDTATFNYRHWLADGSGAIEVVDPGFFNKPSVEGCELYTSETVTGLAAGDTVEFCQIFASADADAQIESVTFKKSGMQKNPRWSWDVKA